MKIGIVTSALVAGGAQRVIVQLIQSWVKDKNEIVLVLLEKKEKFFSVPKEVKLYEIGRQRNNSLLDKVGRYSKVRKILNSENVDVVLSLPEEIGIYVIGCMLCTHIPVVVSERNNPWKMPYKKETRILRKILYPFCDGIVFQTREAASFFSNRIQKKGIILPNPLDINRIPNRFLGKRDKRIVGVGRLEPQKNFKLLIDAFSKIQEKYSDYTLHIYGEGSMREDLENYAFKKLKAGTWNFEGKDPNVLDHINSAACFVLSSDYEGVPNVLIEAMASGIPCVSTDCEPGGARILISNRINGMLVEVRNPDALAQSIIEVISNTSLSSKISEEAVFIKDQFEAKKVSKEWLQYLLEITKR